MPRLFEEFPRLESERMLREWQPSDAPALVNKYMYKLSPEEKKALAGA